MIKKYSCTVTPTLESTYLHFFTESMNVHNLKRDRILNKWFYFYANNPVQPIIFWGINNSFRVEPGTNRYIGVALRESNIEIDAIYITDNDTNIPNEIKLVNYIGCSDFDLESYKRFDTTSDLCKWAVGSVTTLNSNDWYKPAFKWIADNLKYTWALDIEGQLYFLNKGYDFFIFPKKIKEVVKVSDHENLEKAVKHLFKKVVECEFR
jgi:hypothetical protein